MNDATDCAGRLRTNAAKESMYSGFAAYSSGVKHQGKIPRTVVSGTLFNAFAITCQPSSTVLISGSVFVQLLCSESESTFSGCFAASHIPTAEPSDNPITCARWTPVACINAATSSASVSVEYAPLWCSDSPVPRKSSEIHVKCFTYSATWNA